MNYATIKKHDVANGPGVRVSLFVSGCNHKCKNCFNSEAWDFNYGTLFTDETIEEILVALKPDYIKGLSLLGGEPFEPKNQSEVLRLLEIFKKTYPEKDVWCYSGFDFEKDMLSKRLDESERVKKMLAHIDFLVDGKFVEKLKNPNLRFKGSANQRIIDVKKSLAGGHLVLWENDSTING